MAGALAEPVEIDKGKEFQGLNKHWFEFSHIASPDKTEAVRQYLEDLCAEITALEDVNISKVSVIVSDDEDPNAFVVDDNLDHAIIAVTKGLIDYVDSEDELFGVLGHEIGHVVIHQEYGEGRNSRPEEIGADGFAAYCAIETGRNWKAIQRFFKKLSGMEKKHHDRLTSTERAKHEIMDVHSTARDRVQHVQTAVGIIAVKKQREIPEPEERVIPESVIEQSKEIKHTSYVDLLLEHHGFADMNAQEQLEFLCDLDRQHYGWVFIPKDKREDESAQKDIMLEREAREARREDFSKYVMSALDRFHAEKAGEFNAQDRELLERVVDVAGFYPETLPYGDEPSEGQLSNLRVYKRVNELLGGDKDAWLPLGSQMVPLYEKATALIRSDSQDAAIAAAQALKEELSAHWSLGFSPATMESSIGDKHLLLHVAYLYRKIGFPHFSGEVKDGEPLPWAQHVEWAKEDESGVIAEMLWRMGVNKDQDLWAAIPPTKLEELSKQWNFTQPGGELKSYAMSEFNTGERNKDGSRTIAMVARKATKAFNEFAREEVKRYRANLALDVPKFEAGTLATLLPEFVLEHEALLSAPVKSRDGSEHFMLPDFDADPAIHRGRTQALLDRMVACLEAGNEDDREAVRGFFLDKNQYGNVPVACLSWIVRNWQGSYGLDNPLTQFVEEDRFGLFTPMEQAEILFHTSRYTVGTGHYDHQKRRGDFDLGHWRGVFGYEQPQSFSDVVKVAHELDILANPTKGKGWNDVTPRDEGIKGRTREKAGIFVAEFGAYLDQAKPDLLTPDFAHIVAFYLDTQRPSMSGYLGDSTRPSIQALILGDHGDARNVPFYASVSDLTSDELIDLYLFFDHEGLFPNLQYKADFGEKVFAEIAAVADIQEQARLLEKLIFTSERSPEKSLQERPLSDFTVTARAIEAWANAMAHIHGIDDGSPIYREAMAPLVQRIKENVPERDRRDVYRALADEVIAQRDLSRDMAECLKLDRKTFEIADAPVRGVEKVLEYMRKNKENRGDALDFFMSLEDDQSIEEVSDKFIAWLDEDLTWRKAPFAVEMGIVTFGELNTSDEEAIALLNSPEVNKHLKDKVEGTTRELHRFFWSRNLDVRTIFVNYLLLTPDELAEDPDAAHAGALELTLNKLFSEEVSDPEEQLRNEWSREFLQVYLENSHEAERSLIMSALISSAQTDRAIGQSQSFGERLSNMLGMLGPAYYKLGQAIHSHPKTPEDIRDPLARLKSMGEKPTRWNYFDRIDRAVPTAMRTQFAWVGDIVGKASFFTTGFVEMRDGNEFMLGLLGENAAAEAMHGFNRIEACAHTMAARNPEFARISQTLIAMISQARDLVEVETDLNLGAKQSMVMQEQYEGLIVEADGHSFRYDPKVWRYYGDEFKLMNIAPGVHFDELPEATPDEVAYKKARAKADSTVELMHMAGGKRFDNDRHERQSRQEGDVVGLFDPGGMLLEEPTSKDKKLLVGALKAILPSITNGGSKADSAASALTDYLIEIEERTGSCPDYLMQVQKALLAQNGFHRKLMAQDFKDILAALIKGNHIDPEIRNPLAFQMAGIGMVNGALAALTKKPAVKISKPDHVNVFQPVYVPSDQINMMDYGVNTGKSSTNDRFPTCPEGESWPILCRHAASERLVYQ